MLPLLRQVRECGCDARLKLRYGFGVITPANLAFASGEDKCLFGSEAPVLRRFPHSLSEFLVRKQQTPLNSGFCHYISFHLDFRRVEKRGRICGGTFVPHLEQKPPHPFPLKNKNLPVETRAASPQPFMFQYVCRSLIIRLPSMHAAPTAVEECWLLSIFVDSWPLSPTTADFYRFPVEFCRLLSTFADFRLPVRPRVFSCFT